jgi:hypothetical protein
MLDAMDNTGDKSIVCWQPHGRAFMVHKPKGFVQEVMSHFFNQTKYASFQRQLNLYGFSRLSHGPDKGAYYHNCFVRGKRHLCKGMIRQKIKGTKVRKSLSPEDEPNFYNMEAQTENVISSATECERETINSSQSSLSLQTSSNIRSPETTNILSSEQSLASLVSIAPSDVDTTSIGCVKSETDAPTLSRDSSNELLHNAPPSTSRVVTVQNDADRWEVYDEVKGGDLLFFEGQPFRYLEHFEELPANQPHTIKVVENDATNQEKLARQLSMKMRGQHPYTTCDTSNDAFQDRLSKIIFNLDSSRSFQKDMMHNTSCSA